MQGGVDTACLSHSKRGSCKTPSLAYGHPNTGWVFTSTLSKPNREFHCPHGTHVTRAPALQFQGEPCQRTRSASYTREAQKQICSRGEEKKLKISAQLHTLLLLSEQPPSRALVRINFKGHWKIPADLKQAGPLCVHTFYCHQHKMRRLGSTSNYKSNVVIKGDKTFWCYTLRKNYLYVALIP